MIHPLARRIFVRPPSSLLTDHRSHGDGLVAYGFLRELAARGHDAARGRRGRRPARPAALRACTCTCWARPRSRARRRAWRSCGGCGGCGASSAARAASTSSTSSTRSTSGCRSRWPTRPCPSSSAPTCPTGRRGARRRGAARSRGAVALKRALRAAQQRRATTVLLSTPAAAAKLAVPPGRHPQVRELAPGIDAAAWAPRPAPGPERQDVLFLANLNPRKGILVAARRVRPAGGARGPRARLLVAGTGPRRPTSGAASRRTPRWPRVRAPGPASTATGAGGGPGLRCALRPLLTASRSA